MTESGPAVDSRATSGTAGGSLGRRLLVAMAAAALVIGAVVLFGLAGTSMLDQADGRGGHAAPISSASAPVQPTAPPPPVSSADQSGTTTTHPQQSTTPSPTRAEAAAQPVRIEIPSLGVETSVMRLGLTPDRTVEVPPFDRADEVGWYTESPTPGATGPSVLIGHVDSPDGPAVFYQLAQLSHGERIRVHRSDGSVAVFAVDRVQTFLKRQFPTQDVYGDTDHPALRLITCGGEYDRSAGGYQGNAVAFADLVDVHSAQQ